MKKTFILKSAESSAVLKKNIPKSNHMVSQKAILIVLLYFICQRNNSVICPLPISQRIKLTKYYLYGLYIYRSKFEGDSSRP